MQDTINDLQIKEPLLVAGLGSIFWGRSYESCHVPPGMDSGDFNVISRLPWTIHYAIPSYGGVRFELKLKTPLRTEGVENVMINIDWLMRSVDRTFMRDGDQGMRVEDLSLPRRLIECLEKLLIVWQGEDLMVDYCCWPEEGNPTSIMVSFSRCRRLPQCPEEALLLVQKSVSESLAA